MPVKSFGVTTHVVGKVGHAGKGRRFSKDAKKGRRFSRDAGERRRFSKDEGSEGDRPRKAGNGNMKETKTAEIHVGHRMRCMNEVRG